MFASRFVLSPIALDRAFAKPPYGRRIDQNGGGGHRQETLGAPPRLPDRGTVSDTGTNFENAHYPD
jgi:hypothetical protein